jgi:hypothetical protein
LSRLGVAVYLQHVRIGGPGSEERASERCRSTKERDLWPSKDTRSAVIRGSP